MKKKDTRLKRWRRPRKNRGDGPYTEMGVVRLVAGMLAHAVIEAHPNPRRRKPEDQAEARAWVRSLEFFKTRPRLLRQVEAWWRRRKPMPHDCPVDVTGCVTRKKLVEARSFPSPTRKMLAQQRMAARKYSGMVGLGLEDE